MPSWPGRRRAPRAAGPPGSGARRSPRRNRGRRAPRECAARASRSWETPARRARSPRRSSREFSACPGLRPFRSWLLQFGLRPEPSELEELGGVGLRGGLRLDEGVLLHARLVDPHHGGIRLEVALVEDRVEHLGNEAAVGHGYLVAKHLPAVLLLLREKAFEHLEAFGDPVAVP